MKAPPRCAMPRPARSHTSPERDRCLRRTPLAGPSAGERRFFFHPPHDGRSMNVGAVALLDQRGQLSRIHIGILLLPLEGKLKHLALEFDRPLAAWLSRKEGNKTQLAESLLNLIEAFPAEAELTTRLRNRISVDGMGAQHLILDLSAIPWIEEIHFEEVGADVFRMGVQRTGSKQGLPFGRTRHEKTNNTCAIVCQYIYAHIRFNGTESC